MSNYKTSIENVKKRLDQSDELFNQTSRADIAKLLDIITYMEFENERLNIVVDELKEK